MHSIPVPRFLSEKYKLIAARVAFSKLTICYLIFSVTHCAIQLGLQGHAFSTNARAATFLWDIVVQGDAKVHGVLSLGSNTDLQVCESFGAALDHSSCKLVWNGTAAKSLESNIIPESSSISSSIPSSSISSTTSTVRSTSVTLSRSSSSLPTTTTRTRFDVSRLTPSPAGLALVQKEHDEYVGLGVVALLRRASAATDEPQESLGNIHSIDTDGEAAVRIDGLGYTDSTVVLGRECLISLNWPASTLDNTKREDIVFIAFQIWVLGMSIVAILNESIPHIIASLFTHMVATGWGAFQIIHTGQFRISFSRLITNGACGINLLPEYWAPRRSAEIASLTLNALALLVGLVLSWRLAKAFGWRTFKRIGASMQIRRQYTAVLVLSVAIQLGLFFIVASGGLWLDHLFEGVAAEITTRRVLYRVLTALILASLIPWLTLGWNSVRKEQRTPMAIFLCMSFLYLVGMSVMFFSSTFRWTFLEWRFFSLVTSASVLLTLSALITGIVCRLGFGKGFPEHLDETRRTEDEDSALTSHTQDGASEISAEIVEFPPLGYPVPTFSSAFRSNDEDATSEKPQFPNPQMGPRFFYGSSLPFNQQAVSEPALAHTRQQPPPPTFPTPHLYQYDSGSSNHSRTNSSDSVDSGVSRNGSGKKRWVIE